jgi:signal transduction histidine kinase
MSGRPCNVSDVLADLVEAVRPLAHKQQRVVKLSEVADPLQVAVEEPALRQALSNLIEGALLRTNVGGNVEIVSTGAPAGGTLVVIDDDGPDMHYMVKIVNSPPYQLVLNNQTRHC